MKKIKNESGRSMVEMLGVLAVIGVLSVGGISGYRMAMNKHHANEWIYNYQIAKNDFLMQINKFGEGADLSDFKEVATNDFYINAYSMYCEDGYCTNYVEINKTPSLKNKDVCVEILSSVNFRELAVKGLILGGLIYWNGYTSSDYPGKTPFTREQAEQECSQVSDFDSGFVWSV